MNIVSKPVKRAIFLTGFFVLFFLNLGCTEQQPEYVSLSGNTMGTRYHVKVSTDANSISGSLQQDIDNKLAGINQIFSTYIDSSEVSTFNQSTQADWKNQSIDFIKVLDESLAISKLTDGAYDVTVSPLVDIWGFGPTFTADNVPSDDEINQALKMVGYQFLNLDANGNRLKKKKSMINIDFSSIAKGYGVDQIAELLEAKGYHHYMVEIGGEMRVSGNNSQGGKWRIAVEKPDAGKRSVQQILTVSNIAIATSGDYRNFFEKDGVRYSHTIDPRTGRPVVQTLVSTTVLAQNCMTADAWATAFMVLGEKKGYDIAIKNKVAVLFLFKNGDKLEELSTPLFKKLIKD